MVAGRGSRSRSLASTNAPSDIWHIAAPVDPEAPSRPVRYPGAGTDNAVVTLAIVDLDGRRVDVAWDRDAFPYLVNVVWNAHGPLTVLVESRDQRTMQILRVDPDTGATALVREDHDDRWLDITVGVPAWLPDGRLVRTVDVDDTKRLTFDDEPVTPVGLQVAQVLDVGDGCRVPRERGPHRDARVARRRRRHADPAHR